MINTFKALKLTLLASAVLSTAAVSASFLTFNVLEKQLTKILDATFPNLKFEFEDIDFTSLKSVSLLEGKITVRGEDSASIRFDSIKADYDFSNLWKRHIDSLAIESPTIHLHPKLIEAFKRPKKKKAAKKSEDEKNPIEWTLGNLTVKSGEFTIAGFGNKVPQVTFLFRASWQNVTINPASPDYDKRYQLLVSNLRAAPQFSAITPFLKIPVIDVSVSPEGLMNRRIHSVGVEDSTLLINRGLRSMVADSESDEPSTAPNTPPAEAPKTTASQEKSDPWMIETLAIDNISTEVSDLGIGVPSIQFALNTQLENVALTGDLATASDEVEQIEFSDFTIHSPYDPFAPVITMESIFFKFSIAGLIEKEIEELIILHPTIYVGEDLFWYIDELKKRAAVSELPPTTVTPDPADTIAEAESADSSPATAANAAVDDWLLKKFTTKFGRLTIATAGAARVSLPINFNSEAENIRFKNFDDLQLKLNIDVPKEDYIFNDYELALLDLNGDVEFGLPAGANNLVNTLYADEVIWKDYRATEMWISVTYDKQGIYGEFGAEIYSGYVNGGFTFFLRDEFPWVGWINGTAVDLKEVTAVLSPTNFKMSGPADFQVQVDATASSIDRVKGSLTTKSGDLVIEKIEEVIENIPDNWPQHKQDILRIGLETLRDFEYDSGMSNFWFIGKKGQLDLKLQGPHGSRNFDVAIHDVDLNQPDLMQRALDFAQTPPDVRVDATATTQ